ncbi:AAA family ATPase [Clostridium perfringens]|uniref:AAA family ATPase n=1 Tax=Clostridium perfringens TaxID=1502 RepID=UPI00399143C7|nr:AAA family ATPase [Clostridium perfringens]
MSNLRWEVNHLGELVQKETELCKDLNSMIIELFSQNNWQYNEIEKSGCYRKIRVSNENGLEYILNVYCAKIRNEKRNSYEKKIQLSGKDPREKIDELTLILGIYVFNEDDILRDSIIVSYPIDKNVSYNTNPSIRGVFTNKILQLAKVDGFSVDSEKNIIAFRPEFIFFYLKSLKDSCITSYCNNEQYYSLPFSRNRIIFGAPGTGKSFRLNKEIENNKLKDQFRRVTFHPNYTYSQFVGSYKPIGNKDGTISYSFVGGPFLKTLIESLKDEKEEVPHILVIEEINRANPAAVFGDVFQLLDRDSKGRSIYNIDMSDEMKSYVNNKLEEAGKDKISELYIPSNMYIWATMNSADQGVYPMDSAFKRRWSFEYIGIDENEEKIEKSGYGIIELPTEELDLKNKIRIYKKYKWNEVRKSINKELKKNKINEDKLLGPFFLSEKELSESRENFDNIFKSKVLMYLYEDILKHKRTTFFKDDVNTLSDIIKNYDLGKIFTFELSEYKNEGKIEDKYSSNLENNGFSSVAENNSEE